VHLWLALLDRPEGTGGEPSGLLDEEEKARRDRFDGYRERCRYACRRLILRKILSRYLGLPPKALQFRYVPYGKPSLAGPFINEDLEFSYSHSCGVALYAFTKGRRIGVDLERLTSIPEAEEIAMSQLSLNWAKLWRRLPPDQKNLTFLQWWTQTEAYLKALGEGWMRQGENPGILGLSFLGGGQHRWSDRSRPGGPWSGEVFFPAPGYVAAVAVEAPEYHRKVWGWWQEL